VDQPFQLGGDVLKLDKDRTPLLGHILFRYTVYLLLKLRDLALYLGALLPYALEHFVKRLRDILQLVKVTYPEIT